MSGPEAEQDHSLAWKPLVPFLFSLSVLYPGTKGGVACLMFPSV